MPNYFDTVLEVNMQIEFKQYENGDVEDPNTGKPINATSESIRALLGGKSVTGVGGISANTEVVVFNLTGMNIWFVTTKGVPRILFQKYEM